MSSPIPPMCYRGEPHHWVLGDPVHGSTPAKCRKCRRVRTYTTPAGAWNGQLAAQAGYTARSRGWNNYEHNERRLAEERSA